jgi:hypothetical protein
MNDDQTDIIRLAADQAKDERIKELETQNSAMRDEIRETRNIFRITPSPKYGQMQYDAVIMDHRLLALQSVFHARCYTNDALGGFP